MLDKWLQFGYQYFMLDLQSCPRHQDGILTQNVSGTTVLLNPNDGQYYALNVVGDRVWALCDGTRRIAEIVAQICQEFDAPKETIEQDVLELLEDLSGEHLVLASQ